MLDAKKKEELMTEAETLAQSLRNINVPRLQNMSKGSRGHGPERSQGSEVGLSKGPLACVVNYLETHQTIEELRTFLDLLPSLDRILAQNPQNPKAEYQVLAGILRRFIDADRSRTFHEIFYILCWTRRLLP